MHRSSHSIRFRRRTGTLVIIRLASNASLWRNVCMVGHTPKGRPKLRCGLDPDLVVHGRSDPLCAAEITLGGLHRDVAEEKLDLLQLAPAARQRRAQLRKRSWGASLLTLILLANSLTTCQTNFSVTASPQIRPALLTRRKRLPMVIPAVVVQAFNRPCTQSGTGMVRT